MYVPLIVISLKQLKVSQIPIDWHNYVSHSHTLDKITSHVCANFWHAPPSWQRSHCEVLNKVMQFSICSISQPIAICFLLLYDIRGGGGSSCFFDVGSHHTDFFYMGSVP